jgi:hypothetical protein
MDDVRGISAPSILSYLYRPMMDGYCFICQRRLRITAVSIRANHPVEYVDYFVKGWSYGWKVLSDIITHDTGKEAWLTTQVSFDPAVMRQFAGVDVRALEDAHMDMNSILFNVQTLERFTMQQKPISLAYESVMIGTHAAREPDAHYAR